MAQIEKQKASMSTFTIIGILIIAIGTLFVHFGNAKSATANKEEIMNYVAGLDSVGRADLLKQLNLQTEEIVQLVVGKNAQSTRIIIKAIESKFGTVEKWFDENNIKISSIEAELEAKEVEIGKLKVTEAKRAEEDAELEKLKRTVPEVDFRFSIENDNLLITTTFNNLVPIQIKPYLRGIWVLGQPETNLGTSGWTVKNLEFHSIYPGEDQTHKFLYNTIADKSLPMESPGIVFEMVITYKSLFYEEIGTQELGEKMLVVKGAYIPKGGEFIMENENAQDIFGDGWRDLFKEGE